MQTIINGMILLLTAVLGLVMGSFINCFSWRYVNGKSVLRGRSQCAACGHTLSASDLIPLVSYLFLGRQCRYCGEKISIRYLFTEIVTAIVFVSLVLRYELTVEAACYICLACILVAVFLIDLDSQIIPNRLIILGIAVFILFTVLTSGQILKDLFWGLLNGLSISLPLLILVIIADKIMKRETMGGGDIKLLFMTGLFFDWKVNILLIVTACIIGIVFAMIIGKAKKGVQFPFGPAITLSVWLMMLFGQPLVSWYLKLFNI